MIPLFRGRKIGRAAPILDRLPRDTPLRCAEVGVFKGMLSAVLLRERPLLTLYMVDIWAPNYELPYLSTNNQHLAILPGTWNRIYREARRAVQFAGPRAILRRMDSVTGASGVADHSLDLAFIDDDHSFVGCTRSILAWMPKVIPGGWICGHDYGTRGPRKCFFQVTEAVHGIMDPLGLVVERGADVTWFVRLPGDSP